MMAQMNYDQLIKTCIKTEITAQEVIICRLDDNFIFHIPLFGSAYETWKKVTVFETKNEISIHLFEQKCFYLYFNPHETVT